LKNTSSKGAVFRIFVSVYSRVWGTARPNKKLSQRGKNFQELKICGHGTVLALTLFMLMIADNAALSLFNTYLF
jgi:hypothetical protein